MRGSLFDILSFVHFLIPFGSFEGTDVSLELFFASSALNVLKMPFWTSFYCGFIQPFQQFLLVPFESLLVLLINRHIICRIEILHLRLLLLFGRGRRLLLALIVGKTMIVS